MGGTLGDMIGFQFEIFALPTPPPPPQFPLLRTHVFIVVECLSPTINILQYIPGRMLMRCTPEGGSMSGSLANLLIISYITTMYIVLK